jgi:predicted dehydrogenase
MTLDRINRRHFLGAAASTAVALSGTGHAYGANDKLLIGVIGTGDRGTGLTKLFAGLPGVEIAYVCDVDQKRVGRAAEEVQKSTGKAPRSVGDFRHLLDDKSVDAVVIATCNHWHGPATILACAAGKHVYVEKPCSHNPQEGELMVAAARKHRRLVQLGTQRRSAAKVTEAIEALHGGVIGRVYLAQAWYTNNRPSIGKGREVPVPAGLDYELWQGPAPRRPFHNNYLHYNWHWFWNWGNGELGNNGIHYMDVCRWGLGVDYPVRVGSAGGRYRYTDDQETPDTQVATFDFADRRTITWEGLSCNRLPTGQTLDILFQGENGSLALDDRGFRVYDVKGRLMREVSGSVRDRDHANNFIEAIRHGVRLNAEIEEGHKSTLLCHLGNIAYRIGRTLHCEPGSGRILQDAEAMPLWTREYAKGWEPKV